MRTRVKIKTALLGITALSLLSCAAGRTPGEHIADMTTTRLIPRGWAILNQTPSQQTARLLARKAGADRVRATGGRSPAKPAIPTQTGPTVPPPVSQDQKYVRKGSLLRTAQCVPWHISEAPFKLRAVQSHTGTQRDFGSVVA